METCEQEMAKLELSEKLMETEKDIAASRLAFAEEIFARLCMKYGLKIHQGE